MANPFLIQPADYTGAFGQLSQGMQSLQQQQQLKQQQAEQAAMKEKSDIMQAGLQEAVATGDLDKVADFMMANPEMSNNVQRNIFGAMGIKDQNQKDQLKSDTFKMLSNPESIEQVLGARIATVQARGGDPSHSVKELEAYKTNPKAFLQGLEGLASSSFSPEYKTWSAAMREGQPEPMTQYQKESLQLRRDQLNQGEEGQKDTTSQQDFKYYQKLKKTDPESAKQYGQQKGYVAKDGQEISVFQQKNLDTAQTASIEANNAANSYDDLATQYTENASELGGGVFGSWKDGLKTATGNEDAASMLRRDWIKIKNSEVIQNLPPGAASETDVAIIMKGYPGDNAKPEEVANFLRAMSKVKKAEGMYNEFKSNYISENGDTRGMLKAWKKEISTPKLSDEDMLNKYL